MSFPVTVRGLDLVERDDRPLHLAIGMFDGLHLGHRSVIGAAVDSARRVSERAGALTFWPHPSRLFRPQEAVPQIMGPEFKARMLHELGVDLVIEQPFDAAFATIPAEDLVSHLQSFLPQLTAIYVGENWRFGRGRTGDVGLLVELARRAGISLVSSPRLQSGGEAISSTRIRNLMTEGDIATANSLLGYPYFAEACVTVGKRLGREIGFPTLNLPWEPELKPRFGVYAVTVSSADGKEHLPAVANYGLRPTISQDASTPLLEVHLLGDSCPFTYRDRLNVEWHAFLRPEQRFGNLEALKTQIARDRDNAASLLR